MEADGKVEILIGADCYWDFVGGNSIRFIDNRYEVKLPFKDGHSSVLDNYSLAQKMLSRQLMKLNEDSEVAKKYDEVIKGAIKQGIIERIDESDRVTSKVRMVTYLPHHHVLRPDKETTKLRVVFDKLAKYKAEGISLNDVLEPGPPLLPLLYDILVRFCAGKVVLVWDIEKVFLNNSIILEHCDFLHFYGLMTSLVITPRWQFINLKIMSWTRIQPVCFECNSMLPYVAVHKRRC